MFKGGVGGQDGVVWFNNSGGNLWSWVDREFQFGFLSIIYRQAFHKEGALQNKDKLKIATKEKYGTLYIVKNENYKFRIFKKWVEN
ncbi:hypothetical protein KUTeg_002167 [Tegillarca granosa]|uniref:Uncharacterized protein n=1 Tax=Tegillarca granosa TaxID=220873 RepID=A0ABQ9FXX2_TEGGR|nr:hypothetical protein KUTeg_002167 [Tegillarca granosa]